MGKKSKIRAVVFDVDGTLYPNWKMLLKSGIFFFHHPFVSMAFARLRKDVREIGGVEDLREAQISLAAGYLHTSREKAAYLLDTHIYGTYMAMFADISPFPEVEHTLRFLRDRGIKIGIISDFPIRPKLSYLGLDEYWDMAISADEIGALKPDPYPFIKAAEILEAEPSEILYIGNNYKYDIIGSKGAGFLSAHFSRHAAEDSIADLTFSDYHILEDFIEKFNGGGE